jgi:DNA gyrase subunit A
MATRHGIVNRNVIEDYLNAHTNGIAAINAVEGDQIVDVALTTGSGEMMLASAKGQTIRFDEDQARLTGRPSKGVIGMKLDPDDEIVDLTPLPAGATEDKLLVVTENGFGKRTPIEEFPTQNRSGKGVLGLKTNAKTGQVVAMGRVHDDDEVMITTLQGKVIRISASDVRVVSRYARGVKVISVDEDDRVVSIVRHSRE